jgi:acyl-CoA reductase-like NAD-dependent aldehyde dehydrogenase
MAKKRKTSKEKQKKISKEIQTLLREYKETGKMTTSRAEYKPRSLEHAQKIAAAIAYGKYGVGKAGRKKKKKK